MRRFRWLDPVTRLWYRLTYCTRHGHQLKLVCFGPSARKYCLNCGKDF